MGAGQSDLYEGTFGDSVGNIPCEISGVQMPNYQNAITPKEKFIDYSLDYQNPNASGKAEVYERTLGFTKDNSELLINQIDDAICGGKVSPYEISESVFGTKYKFRIPVKGVNGQIKDVIAVYQIDTGTDVPRMVTNYVEKKK